MEVELVVLKKRPDFFNIEAFIKIIFFDWINTGCFCITVCSSELVTGCINTTYLKVIVQELLYH